jgi:hypothetical protein
MSARPLWAAAVAGGEEERERKRLGFGDEIQRLWFVHESQTLKVG